MNFQRRLEAALADDPLEKDPIVVTDSDGRDVAGSICVALLAVLYDADRVWVPMASSASGQPADVQTQLSAHRQSLTKDAVRKRLQWLISDANAVVGSAGPARAWLNRVNEVLLSDTLLGR